MLTSIRQPLLLVLLSATSSISLANYKCTDSQGRNTYQEQPCKTGSKQQALVFENPPPAQSSENPTGTARSATSQIFLDKAEIFQQGPDPSSGFVSFTLRPHWSNRNKTKVRVNYKVRFLDWKGIELDVDSRFKDIEASSSSTSPQVLATFYGKPSDRFKYKDVASATITFSTKGEEEEKIVEKIRITRQ